MHRLDRLTSGVVLLARTKEASESFSKQMTALELSKEYLARVKGFFPEGGLSCQGAIACKDVKVGIYAVDDKDPKAKSAETHFSLIKRMPDGTSLLLCKPKTGRTHQIRVHLQHLGYPIANDGSYGGDDHFPGTRCHAPHLDEQPNEKEPRDQVVSKDGDVPVKPTVAEGGGIEAAEGGGGEAEMRVLEGSVGGIDEAKKESQVGDDGSKNGWRRHERSHAMEIWLHARKYTSATWAYEAEPPEWARAPETNPVEVAEP